MSNQTWDRSWLFSHVNTDSASLPQQVAHSTCGDSEYNLRSRTVVCGSCGLPSDKSSSCSVSSASRSFRSGGLSEGLLPHSYVFSTSTPRKVGTDIWPPLNLYKGPIRKETKHSDTKLFNWDFFYLYLLFCPRRPDLEWRAVQSCEPLDPETLQLFK